MIALFPIDTEFLKIIFLYTVKCRLPSCWQYRASCRKSSIFTQ